MSELKKNTVQQTLCLPLCGRMIAAQKYPHLFPDKDAERIVRELGQDVSGRAVYRLQYMWINCVIRQYNLAWEITEYLKKHPPQWWSWARAFPACGGRWIITKIPGTAWIWRT